MKGEVTLTFYGGVNEVGGNKVLLEDRDVKILLDFGVSFSARSRYYSGPFLSPRSELSLLELGMLPRLPGVYKFDESEGDVDAVFLSHSHMDHAAYISFLKPYIPIYCGETTKIVLKALSQVRPAGLEFDIRHVQLKTFRTGEIVKIGHVKVEPIHVDHSVPGSYGFIVHTSSGAIVYTGDFRVHGTRPDMTEDFVKRAKEAEPIAMIPEGTNLTGAHVSSEPEVRRELIEVVRQSAGLVLADFSYTDIDRLRSFYEAVKEVGRRLVITLKQAYLLKELKKDERLDIPSLNDENILLFQREKEKYYKWEKELLDEYNDKVVDAYDVSKKQNDLVLTLPLHSLEELIYIRPIAGSCYILSASEPFNEEMEMDYERLTNWLEHHGLPQYHIHVSGHIMPLQLKRVIDEVRAKKVFPVHTDRQELLSKFVKSDKSEVVMVERERKYVL